MASVFHGDLEIKLKSSGMYRQKIWPVADLTRSKDGRTVPIRSIGLDFWHGPTVPDLVREFLKIKLTCSWRIPIISLHISVAWNPVLVISFSLDYNLKNFNFKSQILWVYDFFVILAWYPNSKNALFDLIRRRGRAEAVAKRQKNTERHEGGDLVQGSHFRSILLKWPKFNNQIFQGRWH